MNRALQRQIRLFMMDAFGDHSLEVFCFDYFPTVRGEFSDGMLKSQKIIMVLDYCRENGRIPYLLAALKRERPDTFPPEFDQYLLDTPSPTITAAQARSIAALVKEITGAAPADAPVHYQTVYAQLHRQFGVRSYKQLPLSKHAEVMAFLRAWLDSLI